MGKRFAADMFLDDTAAHGTHGCNHLLTAPKKDLFVAMLIGNEPKPVTWQLANEPNAVRRLVRKLEGEAPGPVRVFYEAGPCGYALQRQVTTTSRITCDVTPVDGTYRFEGVGTLAPVLAGILPHVPHNLASPTGFEPVFWP
jgi:hypothetical protein